MEGLFYAAFKTLIFVFDNNYNMFEVFPQKKLSDRIESYKEQITIVNILAGIPPVFPFVYVFYILNN